MMPLSLYVIIRNVLVSVIQNCSVQQLNVFQQRIKVPAQLDALGESATVCALISAIPKNVELSLKSQPSIYSSGITKIHDANSVSFDNCFINHSLVNLKLGIEAIWCIHSEMHKPAARSRSMRRYIKRSLVIVTLRAQEFLTAYSLIAHSSLICMVLLPSNDKKTGGYSQDRTNSLNPFRNRARGNTSIQPILNSADQNRDGGTTKKQPPKPPESPLFHVLRYLNFPHWLSLHMALSQASMPAPCQHVQQVTA